MRIWSLHPKHLDAKGLVALWRETLLAKHVLNGSTKGYTNHPQLTRFKTLESPLDGIDHYLAIVHEEASRRGYKFDASKVNWNYKAVTLTVTSGQMAYEILHLERKLAIRDEQKLEELKTSPIDLHPIFSLIDGEIEAWEVVF